MILNLRAIPSGRSLIEQQTELSEEQKEGVAVLGPVACRAEADRLSFQIHLTVTFRCTVELECSRCLKRFSYPLHGTYRLLLQDREGARRVGSVDEGAVDFFFTEEDTEVDTRQTLYDEIVTALPLMPLCSADCPGIVREEESDTNSRKAENVDPRWEALRRLQQGRTE